MDHGDDDGESAISSRVQGSANHRMVALGKVADVSSVTTPYVV